MTPVPAIKDVPIILFAGKVDVKKYNMSSDGCIKAHRVISMISLRKNTSMADVCLESMIQYDFANLKARG